MTAPLAKTKSNLREQVRAKLKTVPAGERAAAATQLCARIKTLELWRAAKSVLFFAPLPDEPDIWPLVEGFLNSKKTVALPRFDSAANKYVACQIENLAEDVVSGKFGIREPKNSCHILPLNRFDLILVPGVAFDLHGRRLGRGKGYYDQLLTEVRGKTCGIAFDEQIVAAIPVEPHDIPLNCILTPTRSIEP